MAKQYKMFWGYHRDCPNTYQIGPSLFGRDTLNVITRIEEIIKEKVSEMVDDESIDRPYAWLTMAYGYNQITDRIIDAVKENFEGIFILTDIKIRCPISNRHLSPAVDRAFDIQLDLKYAGSDIRLISEGTVTIDNGTVELHESY